MNTKQFEVIPVEDYGVIIKSGENPIHHADTVSVRKLSNGWIWSASYFGQIYCPPIIATVGKRIEGIPLIEIPDENETLYHKISIFKEKPTEDGNYMTDCGIDTWVNGLGFIDNRVQVMYWYKAAQRGTYTEEDMRSMLIKFVGTYSGKPLREPFHGTEVLSWADNYIQSLQKKKLPKAVVLEMDGFHFYNNERVDSIFHLPDENVIDIIVKGEMIRKIERKLVYQKEIKITNTEINTITPIQIDYYG